MARFALAQLESLTQLRELDLTANLIARVEGDERPGGSRGCGR
jgi:hypothetical protein